MPLSEKWAESKIRGWADPEKKKKSDEDAEPFDNNTRLSIFQNGCIQIPDVAFRFLTFNCQEKYCQCLQHWNQAKIQEMMDAENKKILEINLFRDLEIVLVCYREVIQNTDVFENLSE